MTEPVDIVRNNNARDLILKGVNELVDSVKVTMGAGGRNVLIEKPFNDPILTKDGVTVAKSINLEDKFENMGAQLVKSVAQKTADEVGDGTTTATVLTGAIFRNSLPYINSGYNPVKIKRYLDMYMSDILSTLRDMAQPVDDFSKIYNISLISSNGDKEIARVITESMDIVGNDGIITVENSNSFQTFVEYTEGIQFDGGYVSPYFVNNPKKLEVEFEKPFISLISGHVNNFDEVEDILLLSLNKNKPIVIFANDFSTEVVNKIVQNRLRNSLKVCLVRLPYYGDERIEFVEDLSIVCNGDFVNTNLNEDISECAKSKLFEVDKINISKNFTTIIKNDVNNDKIKDRIDQITLKLNESKSPVEQNTLRDRISKLSGSVAIIKVGGSSEVEVQEKKDRIDDALHATKASIKGGVVIGGGYALLKCSYTLCQNLDIQDKENLAAYAIIKSSLQEPAKQILSNAGLSVEYIYDPDIKLLNNIGVNIYNGEKCNLFVNGIIDPLLVEEKALQNAISVSGLLITTDCSIALKKKEEDLM